MRGEAHLVDVVLVENSAAGFLFGRVRLKNVAAGNVRAVRCLGDLGCLSASLGSFLLLVASDVEDTVSDLTLEHGVAHFLLGDTLTVVTGLRLSLLRRFNQLFIFVRSLSLL